MKAYRIYAVGVVQGVGFRPYVKLLADRLGVRGYVRNLAAARWRYLSRAKTPTPLSRL